MMTVLRYASGTMDPRPITLKHAFGLFKAWGWTLLLVMLTVPLLLWDVVLKKGATR